jgi:type II secretory ATPase GspE/PulE/Tfp pilus assembly ATPase PilB-like protein
MSGKSDERFWRELGEGLGEGVPLAEALRRVGEEELALALERGLTLSEALLEHPDRFESAVVGAVRAAEQSGTLDREAIRIADALGAGEPVAAAGERDDESAPAGARAGALVDALLDAVVDRGASDIHLDPLEDGSGHVRLRVDGVLESRDPVPAELLTAVVARLKTMAGLDIAERRRGQFGRIVASVRGRDLDVRLTTGPTVHGERAVMRVLDPRQVRLRIDDVFPPGDERERIRSLATLPHGLVIVNGPTGSGKTTTLYCMLAEANRPGVSLVSIEDPVEYLIPGVVQMQVAPQFDFTFLAAHKAVLRQDPDVVMIGEIRDLEQLVLSAQTAMTGHLVLTTLHARSSAEAVMRMLSIGIEPFLLNASLTAIVSQLLVRKLCPDCREPAEPDPSLIPPEAKAFLATLSDVQFHARKGCPKCGGSGIRGRAAINEILVMDEGLRRAVADSPDESTIREAARRAGMKTLLESAIEQAARGVTTVEEALRVALA